MRWLSKGAEVLTAELKGVDLKDPETWPYDAIVVGSGYGGAVAALRLRQAGYRVCVLERGEELLPGEFPNDMAHVPGHLRIERADRPGVIGKHDGLFDVRLHGRVTTLVGNGLGGGSLINANVALRADPEVMRDPRWPAELRAAYDPLDAYYTRAEGMLGVAPYPHNPAKARELQRLAEPLNERLKCARWTGDKKPLARFYKPPLAISYECGDNAHSVWQDGCTGCGDCVTGCNVGAKNTLTMNYLPEAKRHGAEIYTGATVVAVRPTAHPADPDAECCEVQFVYSDRDWTHVLGDDNTVGAQWNDNPDTIEGLFKIRACMVVLAAGAIGSTEILLRSAYLNRVRMSPRLGGGISGNGDALHFGFDQDEPVNGIGWGKRFGEHCDLPFSERPGPSIVGVLDVRSGLPTANGVLIEDGIIPGTIANVTGELVTTAALFAQLDACGLKREGTRDDPLAVNPAALQRTQVYLGIGHDTATSEMRVRNGRAFIDWREGILQPAVARQKDYLKVAASVAQAVLVANPASEPLPGALDSVLSGPAPTGTALVVHPLGGCPMGDDFEAGVVNHLGAVFSGESPRSVYRSLFVWDGAIVPTSLGVNPFLTITALAERAASLTLAADSDLRQRPERGPLDPRPQVPAYAAPGPECVAVRLQETMEELRPDGDTDERMLLKLRMGIPDLECLLRDRHHRITDLRGYLKVPKLSLRRPLRVERGSSVELMVSEPSSRCGRTWRGLCAWWRKRGRDELCRTITDYFDGKRSPPAPDNPPWWKRVWRFIVRLYRYVRAILRLAHHAGERRLMVYRLRLRDSDGKRYHLHGVKTIDFTRPGNRLLHSLTDLDTKLVRNEDGRLLRSAIMRLNLVALAEEDLPQVRAASDQANALITLAGLPLFFARVLLKICLLDFRAPDYAPRSPRLLPEIDPDRTPSRQRAVLVQGVSLKNGPTVRAQHTWLEVPRGGLSDDPRTIPLALTRLRPPGNNAHATPLLMLPGFAQSTVALTCERLDEDLTRHMLAKGFDVWLFDYRTSTALPSAREQCSLDDIAARDIPAAVKHIVDTVKAEGWRPRWKEKSPAGELQIAAFGHCMGSATLAMSLLSGALENDALEKYGKPLHTVVLSQVPPLIVASDYSRYRRQFVAFLRDALGLHHVNFAADDGVDARELLMDRLFATLPAMLGECPHEHDRAEPRTDIATCKRISGVIGPLYVHDNVKLSHDLMHQYFGWGSTSVFMQITKFFEYERLVSADGVNHYVTDDNIRRHLDIPVALLHGKRNQVFDYHSALRTDTVLRRVNGPGKCVLIGADNYAHFDCLVGDKAHQDIYPRVSDFLLRQIE